MQMTDSDEHSAHNAMLSELQKLLNRGDYHGDNPTEVYIGVRGRYNDQNKTVTANALILKHFVIKSDIPPYRSAEWRTVAALEDCVAGFKLFAAWEPTDPVVFAYKIGGYADKWIIDTSRMKPS
jgi:hypothetical protein